MIRTVTLNDAQAIADIYNEYIVHTCITFETAPVSPAEMADRIRTISSTYPYFVYEADGEMLGYCYAHGWKEKQAYRQTAETTVYVKKGHTGKGIGQALMQQLIDVSQKAGLHVLIACITYPNEASVRLHEKLGFKQVSRFNEVGRKFGQWLDIYDFQLVLSE
ncbi:N-acetyltransferase [Phocaeicola barnesiae]|uniref:GNAT family N-acetyltransferase n=1 Tax=Phocaeicola barnesiae TaxID=376804 RepID=UPI001F1DFA73|nr:GNAT family N-acetyltransferase [Phocaeicola barnesiae]MCF2597407.1 N-acetyltransferase [Phocaeicola barnesiae]